MKASGTPPDLFEKTVVKTTAFYDLYLDLIDGGVDWFRETVEYSRHKGLSVWISLRMNDTHGGRDPDRAFDRARCMVKRSIALRGEHYRYAVRFPLTSSD